MAIFDLSKDDLLSLTDVQLEELVSRLAEADVAAQGFSPSAVVWSGSINAPDGGIDVRVELETKAFNSGYLKRPNTILQIKRPFMGPEKIKDEMTEKGEPTATVVEQAQNGGSYIMVSLKDDCSPPKKTDRVSAAI